VGLFALTSNVRAAAPPPRRPSASTATAAKAEQARPTALKTRRDIDLALPPSLALLFGAHWAGEASGLAFDLGVQVPLTLQRCYTPVSGPEYDVRCVNLPENGIGLVLGLTPRLGYSYSADPGARHLATPGLGISFGRPYVVLTPFADLAVGSLAGDFVVGVRGGVSLALVILLALEVSYESLSPAGPGGGELRVTGGVNVIPLLVVLVALAVH
jgi:hypothetical protein